MAVSGRSWQAQASSKTAATTIVCPAPSSSDFPQVGDLVVIATTTDNASATTPTISSVAITGAGAIGPITKWSQTGAATSAGGSSMTNLAWATVTTAFTAASGVTVTMSASVTARAAACSAWTGANFPAVSDVKDKIGTATTSVTAPAGAVALGWASSGNATTQAWASGSNNNPLIGTTGGTATTNVTMSGVTFLGPTTITQTASSGITGDDTAFLVLTPAPVAYTAAPADPVGVTDDAAYDPHTVTDPVSVADGVTTSIVRNYKVDLLRPVVVTPGDGSSASATSFTATFNAADGDMLYLAVTTAVGVTVSAPGWNVEVATSDATSNLSLQVLNCRAVGDLGSVTFSLDVAAPVSWSALRCLYISNAQRGTGSTSFGSRSTLTIASQSVPRPGWLRVVQVATVGSTLGFSSSTGQFLTLSNAARTTTTGLATLGGYTSTAAGNSVFDITPASAGLTATYDLPSDADVVPVTDSVTADLVLGVASLTGAPIDPVGAADSATPVADNARSQPDQVGATDSVTAVLGASQTVSDPVGLTDSIGVVLNRIAAITDPVAGSDAASSATDIVRSLSDAVGATDAVTSVQGLSQAPGDIAGVTDSITVALVVNTTAPADSVAVTDSASALVAGVRILADSVGATDVATDTLDAVRQVDDQLGATDTATLVVAADRQLAESVAVTDIVAIQSTLGGSAADTAAVTDAATAVLDVVRSQGDAVGVTDTRALATTTVAFDTAGSSVQTGLTTTSFTVDITTAAVGADCFAFVAINVTSAALTLPGWTQVVTGTTTSTLAGALFWRRKVAGDTTFTGTQPTGRSTTVWASYTGVDTSTYETATSGNILAKGTSSTTVATPSVSETGGDSWALAFFADRTSTSANRPMAFTLSGLTKRVDDTNGAAASSPWTAAAIGDSGSAVTAGAHSYAATIPFAEAFGLGGLIYLQPAVTVLPTYGMAPADPIGVTDAVTVVWDRAVAPTEPVGVADAAATALDAVRTLTDPVGVSDSTQLDRATSAVETVGVADTATALSSTSRTVGESVSVSDATTVAVDRVTTLSEPVAATDSATAVQVLTRASSDAVGVTDATTLDRFTAVTDPLGVTDATSAARDVVATPTDSVGVSDSLAAQLAGVSTSTLSEPVGVEDATAAAQGLDRVIIDAVAVTDSANSRLDRAVALVEPVAVTDQASATRAAVLSSDDLIGITDTTAVAVDRALTSDDPVGVTDAVASVVTSARAATVSDAVPVTDVATADLAVVAARVLDDSAEVTDRATTTASQSSQLDDAVATTDAVEVVMQRVVEVTDFVQAADDLALDYLQAALLDDDVQIADEISAVLQLGFVLASPDETHVVVQPQPQRWVTVEPGLRRQVVYRPAPQRLAEAIPTAQRLVQIIMITSKHVTIVPGSSRYVRVLEPRPRPGG